MKKSLRDTGWSVHYSHIRPEPPQRWTQHGPLETEQEAIEVARVLQSQGLIVFAIHEGDDPRLDEGALRERLTGLDNPGVSQISEPAEIDEPGTGSGGPLESDPRS